MYHSTRDAYKFVLDLLQPASMPLKVVLGETGQRGCQDAFLLEHLGVRQHRVILDGLSNTVTDEDVYTWTPEDSEC